MSKPALLGGKKTKTKPFPEWPVYDECERKALEEVLESRVWWRTPGVKTLEFERNFASHHGTKHGIAITNGTAAIEVILAALGIGPGDEVIIPDFTFVATASAVLFTGALPVMVDIRPDTYCIDPALAGAAITDRTRAIIAVHMGGCPADLDALKAITDKNNLYLIEDSAHAHGSQYNGVPIGNVGVAATFSFQSSKLMTAGEGGIIITSDDEIEQRARSVHDCGRMPDQWFYSHYIYGSNYRLSEWQGAVLSCQLARLDEQTKKRHENGRLLDRLLADIEGVTPQSLDDRCTRNGHYAYIFHVDARAFAGMTTDRFIEALEAEGIPHQASYPPVHALDLFQSKAYKTRLCPDQANGDHRFLKADFPVTSRAAWETVWIPQYALLGDEEDMHEIAGAIRKIREHARDLA